MIFNYKFHYKARMMLSISEQSSWALHKVNQQEWYSIPVLSIWPLHQCFVMMKQQETINSKNTIHCQEDSSQEIRCTKDVKQWLMICINQIQIKYCQRHHQNLPMVQQSFRASSGKTIHAYNL